MNSDPCFKKEPLIIISENIAYPAMCACEKCEKKVSGNFLNESMEKARIWNKVFKGMINLPDVKPNDLIQKGTI